MDDRIYSYIKTLINEPLPSGKKLLSEGFEIGKKIVVPKTRFLKCHNCETYGEYRRKRLKDGKQTWQLLVGLATLEDELNAIAEIEKFNKRNASIGMEVSGVQSIPAMITGLPHEYWDKAPKQTSYEMRNPSDWKAHNEVADIQVSWQDFHLSCPAALTTTINALEAGTDRLGCFSTLTWDYPGYSDQIKRFSDMVRSIGIVASKKDKEIDIVTYAEDGIPAYFLDIVSWYGYTLIENYIVSDLCGALFSVSYGGLLTDINLRLGFALAIHKTLSTDNHCALTYFNGGTTDQLPHDINCNFGTGVQEALIQILFNLKYQTPIIISPVATTECLRTPSLEELLDIASAGMRAEWKAHEWLPLMDFTPIEKCADLIIEKGTKFFNNALDAFKKSGIDITDTLQMILTLKRFNPLKFEESFHPSIEESGEFKAYCPSPFGLQVEQTKNTLANQLIAKNYDLAEKKIVCVSADTHTYGLFVVDGIFKKLGANVINGGVDVEPIEALDLADEMDADIICVSVHCGQSLAYSKTLTALSRKRNKKYKLIMGGMLNALLPGGKLPTDVSDQISKTDVLATNDFETQIQYILQ